MTSVGAVVSTDGGGSGVGVDSVIKFMSNQKNRK